MGRPTYAIQLSKAEQASLRKQIQNEPERRLADRLRVILYKAEGEANQSIAQRLQMGRKQVGKVLERYTMGGLAALLQEGQRQGSQAKMNKEQQQALKVELLTQIYATAWQVIAWVKQQWQIEYEVSAMHKLLKRLGLSYKKNRLVPSQADPELQRQFVAWYRGLCQRLAPDDRIYFGDAAHFKHNAEAGYAWSLLGKPHLIPSNSGRQRYNVLGAYSPQSHEFVGLLTEENITQDKLCRLLPQLRQKHPTHARIYLILDNARYNYTEQVRHQADLTSITIDFLPPYSPNLNPIERLWKFVRKLFFKDKYRATFQDFRTQLQDFFANLHTYREQLQSLITQNFDLIPATWTASRPA
jgi:transposase